MDVSKPAKRNSSRTLAIAAVVLLIVVAVAGIVLAGRQTSVPVQGTAAALPDASAAAASALAAGPTSGANEVMFATGSDKMPAQANESIAKFAEGARSVGGTVRLSVRYLTGENKVRGLELAKTRSATVRHALESNGIKAEQMQVEMVEMPAGSLTPKDADRVELSLR